MLEFGLELGQALGQGQGLEGGTGKWRSPLQENDRLRQEARQAKEELVATKREASALQVRHQSTPG